MSGFFHYAAWGPLRVGPSALLAGLMGLRGLAAAARRAFGPPCGALSRRAPFRLRRSAPIIRSRGPRGAGACSLGVGAVGGSPPKARVGPGGPPSACRARTSLLGLAVIVAFIAAPGLAWGDEAQLLALDKQWKHVSARRLSEEWVREHPKSVTGHYVLGRSLWIGEGRHAEARHHLEEADRLFDGAHSDETTDQLRIDLYYSLFNLLGEVGDYPAQERYADRFDLIVTRPLGAERGWSQMKAGQIDRARATAQAGIASEIEWQKTTGHNTLCALEARYGTRQEGYDACIAALQHERGLGHGDLAVAAGNAGLGAVSAFRFEEAETLFREGLGGPASNANPWASLANLYLSLGRTEDVAEAIAKAKRYQMQVPANLRSGSRAELDGTLALFLLGLGETDKGLVVIDRALQFPDRRGGTSSSADATLAGHTLVRIAMRRVAAEREAESRTTRPLWRRASGWISSLAPDPADWQDRAVVAAVLTDPKVLASTIRPYLDGGIVGVPRWVTHDLVSVLGPGVVNAAIDEARRAEPDTTGLAYLDALGAEAAWASGDERGAEALAASALANLPPQERLLRARMAVVQARVAEWNGQSAEALWQSAWSLNPGVLRLMGAAVPATFQDDGSALAGPASAALGRSPRFRAGPGFVVDARSAGSALTLCLLGADQSQLVCSTTDDVPAPDGAPDDWTPSDDDRVVHAVGMFHRRAFGLPLGVNLQQLDSLDGTNVVATEARRERLEKLLKDLEK